MVLRRALAELPELLARLQAEVPDTYPEKLLRTLQRRVKQWRGEAARRLVFGAGPGDAVGSSSEATGAPAAAAGVADATTGMAG